MKQFSGLLKKLHRNVPDENISSETSLVVAICFVFGLLCASCICHIAGSAMVSRALDAKLSLAENVSRRSPSFANARAGDEFEGFAKNNPFDAAVPPQDQSTGGSSYSADSFVLVGTLPHIGAWITDDEGTHMVLLRQQIKGWTLEDVRYGRALVSKNGEGHALYISLSGSGAAPATGPAPAGRSIGSGKIDFSGIQRAENGKEGTLPREVLDKLIMNPYDEIAKMKMVPADGGGMRLERIAPDSVLGLVGVSQGDVIKAVNGVTISNLGDLSNAVNSMMSGTMFDVMVSRDGKPLDLKYQVK